MRVTIEIDSRLIGDAQALALREETTLDALVERGLNLVLSEHRHGSFKLQDASVDGSGLHPDVAGRSWDALISSLDRFSSDFVNEREQHDGPRLESPGKKDAR